MAKPALLPDECIASDDPTWIIDTELALAEVTAAQTVRSKNGRPLLRWTLLAGLVLVAGGAAHLVATACLRGVSDRAIVTEVTRTEGPSASPLNALPTETEAVVRDVQSAAFMPSAHDELAKTLHEPNEAEWEASLDGHDEPQSSISRTLTLGRRLLRARRLAAARAAFESVLAARRGHPAALCGLARVALVSGELDVAKNYADRCVRRAPNQAAHRIVLGDVLRRLSQTAAADAEYRRASRLSRSRPVDTAARSLPANPF